MCFSLCSRAHIATVIVVISLSYGPQCNGSIYAQELYSKLVTLHVHQQAQEMLARVAADEVVDANTSLQQRTEVENYSSLYTFIVNCRRNT